MGEGWWQGAARWWHGRRGSGGGEGQGVVGLTSCYAARLPLPCFACPCHAFFTCHAMPAFMSHMSLGGLTFLPQAQVILFLYMKSGSAAAMICSI